MKQKDGGEDYIEIVTKDLKECKNYFERAHLRFAKFSNIFYNIFFIIFSTFTLKT